MQNNLIDSLIKRINRLTSLRQIVIFGAAVVDFVSDIEHLPRKGEDIALHKLETHIGGCALNIAMALHRLDLPTENAIPLGTGYCADIIKKQLARESITTALQPIEGDNGWCLALVDPEGERTFLSVHGIEEKITVTDLEQIKIQESALIYLSGYQLIGASANQIMTWLTSLSPSVKILVDFGPRIAEIPRVIIQQLLQLNVIFTLNRQEAYYLQNHWLQNSSPTVQIDKIIEPWFKHHSIPLIIRMDREGAFCCSPNQLSEIPSFPTHVVDSIGAGDSHSAGLLAGLAAGWSIEEATLFANAIASYVVSHEGGDCSPNRATLINYLQRYRRD